MEVSKANSKWNKHIIFSPEAFRGKHEWVSRVDLACVLATSGAPMSIKMKLIVLAGRRNQGRWGGYLQIRAALASLNQECNVGADKLDHDDKPQ